MRTRATTTIYPEPRPGADHSNASDLATSAREGSTGMRWGVSGRGGGIGGRPGGGGVGGRPGEGPPSGGGEVVGGPPGGMGVGCPWATTGRAMIASAARIFLIAAA